MIEGKLTEEQCIASAMDMFGAGVDTVNNYNVLVHFNFLL